MYTVLFDPYTAFVVFTVACVYHLEVHKSLMNAVAIKYQKCRSLVNLVKTQYKNIFMIFWVCLCLIVKNTYLIICQKLNKSVLKLGKNTYEVIYVINGIRYVMHIQAKRGPKMLIQALDALDNDMTEVIQSYLGPMENFHGQSYTPAFFGTSEVTLSLSTGEEKTFKENEPIKL